MEGITFQERLADLQRELGRLTTNFARFETSLGCAVGFLANPGEYRIGHILVAEISFKARLAAFSALYPERVVGAIDEAALDLFLSEAHRLEDQRNKLIHSFYWPGPVGDPSATRVKTTAKGRKGLKIQFEDVTPEIIGAEADKAWAIPRRLDDLMLKLDGYGKYVAGFYALFHQK